MTYYCFDANIVINLHRRFPRDIWPTVWDRIEALVAAGHAVLPREVLIELDRIDDNCVRWCKSLAGFVVEPDAGVIATVTDLANRFPGWVSQQQNQADPWIVAQALRASLTVVTEERRRGPGVADHNLGIPNVADAVSVPTMTFNNMVRAEGWSF